MVPFKIYHMGGSCCSQRLMTYDGKVCLVKEIRKDVQGVENGFDKFYHEIQHMIKYAHTGLFPEIYKIVDTADTYTAIMEYCYCGMTLSDLIRNESVELQCFKDGFRHIMTDIIKRLYTKHYEVLPPRDYLEQCYYCRVEDRIGRVIEENMPGRYGFSDVLSRIIKNGCHINGEYYPPVFEYIKFMRSSRQLAKLLKIHFSCHVHYDLCPTNILVDYCFDENRIRDFCLIDVRGEGDTGPEKRHYIYDMGKMLLGLDAFDLFRIFNGREGTTSYAYHVDRDDKIVSIDFAFLNGGMAKRYRDAQQFFWDFFENNAYFQDIMQDSAENLRAKFLFSQSMMYHPDVPCRIIYEQNEELAILMFMRGLMLMRFFLESVLGQDPVGKFNGRINIWEGLL